jgi:hypothetical protein
MHLPRLRLTIRWMMLAVVGAGTVLGASVELQRHHDRFLRLAKHDEASSRITWVCGRRAYYATNGLGEDVRGWSGARIEWHRRLGETYRLAASRPWVPVEPDPPEPQ